MRQQRHRPCRRRFLQPAMYDSNNAARTAGNNETKHERLSLHLISQKDCIIMYRGLHQSTRTPGRATSCIAADNVPCIWPAAESTKRLRGGVGTRPKNINASRGEIDFVIGRAAVCVSRHGVCACLSLACRLCSPLNIQNESLSTQSKWGREKSRGDMPVRA